MNRNHLAAHNLTRSLIVGLFMCLAAISTATPVSAAGRTEKLLIGIEPEHNIFDQMEQYRYLGAYLSDQLGVKVQFTIMSRYGEVIKRFKTLNLDGAVLTPYTTVLGMRELNLEPMANPVNLNNESTSQGYIFARKDSGIRGVKDMQGKSIVFVDPATMEGYLFPLAYLKQHGIMDFSKFFSRFYASGSHASAIFAVLDGRADIGAAKSTAFNKLVRNDPSIQQELDIIAQSPRVPEFTLCIKNDIDQDLRVRLAAVLFQMDKNALGQKVLKQFKALRFVKSNKADFAKIEEMVQEIRPGTAGHGK